MKLSCERSTRSRDADGKIPDAGEKPDAPSARRPQRTLGVRRVRACGRILRRTDFRRNRVPNTAERREYAQERESAAVDHFLPIHLNG